MTAASSNTHLRVSSCRAILSSASESWHVAAEALRSLNQPQVELVLLLPEIRDELCLETLRIVDEITGMDAEKLRQQQPGGVGQVPA